MSQSAEQTPSFRRIAIDRYEIVLGQHRIGEVLKGRSIDHRGNASKPFWVATAEAAHPFGVARAEHLQAKTRLAAAKQAVRAYNELCANVVAPMCRLDLNNRAS
ncbi:hypothetical protein [Mycolicibacterium llatzerense]|uniref:hypothetical protein n=1 Tax=Mycolicibacterium llatzerense TaxID=280871 RepID=UPI0021B4FB1B|nr:hypothetical protein [Mycolicibacterium llatzerense]MCT7372150.1 hypothetical protein [Mycolicibacterium llatzerense]